MKERIARILCLATLLCVCVAGRNVHSAETIVVGSKIFTEGYVLGELAAQTLEASSAPVPVTRKLGMGSTGILFQSLSTGAIDVYADYTGTLTEAIIKNPQLKSLRSTNRYSAFTLTLGTIPTSRPAPTVQPAVVLVPAGKPGRLAATSPSARPALR